MGVSLPPPKLAMREMEARREAAAREEEARLRRQNAVHALLKKVAKQNETRLKRGAKDKDHHPKDSGGGGSVYKPPGKDKSGKDEAAAAEGGAGGEETSAERAARRAAAREREKPWRSNIKPTFWQGKTFHSPPCHPHDKKNCRRLFLRVYFKPFSPPTSDRVRHVSYTSMKPPRLRVGRTRDPNCVPGTV